MAEALALILLIGISYLRDPYYLHDLHKRASGYAQALRDQHETSGGFTWAALVLSPFLLLLAVQAAIAGVWLAEFLLAAAVLSFTLKFRHYNYFLERLMRALYGNDRPQTEYLSRKWGGLSAASITDVLKLCAERLHADLFIPMFWFGVFGPAGAYLGLAHLLVGRIAPVPSFLDNLVRMPVQTCSVILTGLAGNFGPAISKIYTADAVGESLVASSGLDPENLDIERVPSYQRLVERVFWAQCAVVALLSLALR